MKIDTAEQSVVADRAGLSIQIHDSDEPPTPHEAGFFANPGYITEISITMVN